MCSRGTLGIFTTSIKRSWAFSFLRPTAARPLHLTSCLERCTAYPSAVQRVALGQLGGDFSQQIFQLGGSILQEAVQTLCFDDATITDLKSSTGSGQ